MQILKNIKRITGNIIHRFFEDQCLRIAASLSFTTLLSLVPLLAVSFAIFAAFPAFNGIQNQLQDFVFKNFVPSAGDVISEYFTNFTQNAGKLTALGITGLAVTAIMLLATIENCLNRIFRVQVRRSRASRLLIFWAFVNHGTFADRNESVFIHILLCFISLVRRCSNQFILWILNYSGGLAEFDHDACVEHRIYICPQ